MPVIRLSDSRSSPSREALVEELANELLGQNGKGEAVIFEMPIRETDTYHVVVAWEAWRLVPAAERSSIIIDAYDRADRAPGQAQEPPKAPRITIALGLTWDDPLLRRALPYSIESHARAAEMNAADVERALIEHGAVKTRTGVQLRFPTQQHAEQVWEQLSARYPAGHWAVVGVGPSLDD